MKFPKAEVVALVEGAAVVEDNKMKKVILSLGVLLMIFLASCSSITGKATDSPGELDGFAQCLTDKGAKMYGTEWCSHCKSQKEMFGNSFQHINYIDCDKQSYLCQSAGVQGYPTWEIDGELYPGEQSFEELSLYSGVEFTEG